MSAYRNEKNADRSKRIRLIIGVRVDGQAIVSTAKAFHMSRTWGPMVQPLQEGGGGRASPQAEDGQAPVRMPRHNEMVRRLSLKTISVYCIISYK